MVQLSVVKLSCSTAWHWSPYCFRQLLSSDGGFAWACAYIYIYTYVNKLPISPGNPVFKALLWRSFFICWSTPTSPKNLPLVASTKGCIILSVWWKLPTDSDLITKQIWMNSSKVAQRKNVSLICSGVRSWLVKSCIQSALLLSVLAIDVNARLVLSSSVPLKNGV